MLVMNTGNNRENLCKYSCESFNTVECNYSKMKKEILETIRGIENFKMLLALK